MASWAKVSADLDSNPKIRKAGREGREVFLFVLRRNAALDLGGRIPKIHVEPWYLADQLMCDEVTASHGLSRAIVTGLLRDEGDEIVIVGWDDEWGKRPLTEAERKAKQRAKDKAAQADGQSPTPDVTKSHDATVTGPDCHASEKKRIEKTLSRENLQVRPPEVGAAAREVWNHAARVHGELKASGIDSTARSWPAMPDASSPGWRDLLDRVQSMLVEDTPEKAIATGKQRVDVARAIAVRDGSLQWFKPSTLFTAKSFDMFADQSPEQIRRKAQNGETPRKRIVLPADTELPPSPFFRDGGKL